MEFTAGELAKILNGTVVGDPETKVTSFAKIENGKKGQLCFYANPKYEQYVYTSKCSILLANKDFVPKKEVEPVLVLVENAYSSLASLLKYVSEERKTYKRHRSLRSHVAWSAKLGSKVYVGDFAWIGRKCKIGDYTKIYENVYIGEGTSIGRKCILYPGVRIYPGMVIGDNVILHANCVIGSDGFGNAPQPDGSWEKIEHLGKVIIGNNVEIGANTTVDRAEMEATIIENGVKIDNLCQIAHNVVVGENTAMAAQTGIAGSTVIGKNCLLGGQVGISGHLKIADGTIVGAKSAVIGNVRKGGQVLFGTPAIDKNTYMRTFALFKQAGLDSNK